MISQPLVSGIPTGVNSSFDTIDLMFEEAVNSTGITDQRLLRNGETKGVVVQNQIDSRDSMGALAFGEDTRFLLNSMKTEKST